MLSGSTTRPAAMVLVTIVLLMANDCSAKVYERCELAKILYRTHKFTLSSLGDWVCMIEAESGRNTRAIGESNSNGSKDYGLFHINSIYWCSGGPKSRDNVCKVPCSALRNDNISDDVRCAKTIYSRTGFSSWYGWRTKCKGKNVQTYIAKCKL